MSLIPVARVAPVGLILALMLAGCRADGAVEDLRDRGTYSSEQASKFGQALAGEMEAVKLPEGFNPGGIGQQELDVLVARAESFCDAVRVEGWSAAQSAYVDPLIKDAASMMGVTLDADTDSYLRQVTAPLVTAQLRAAVAPGSLCPELAPPDFLTIPPPSAAAMEGTYYGDGCAGASRAFASLLEIVQGLPNNLADASGDADELIDIAAGLMVAAAAEPNHVRQSAINSAANAVVALSAAITSGDVTAVDQVIKRMAQLVMDAATACGL